MRLTRLFFAAIILLALGSVALAAEENAPADGKNRLVGEIGMDFYSRYVGNTFGSVAYNRPAVQGNIKLSLDPIGFYAKVWGSGALTQDGGNRFGNEIDLIVGIARPIWIFKVDFGYAYYDLHPQFRSRGDMHAVFGTISLPNRFVEPYITVECDIPTDKKTLEGGWAYRVGLSKSIGLRKNLALTGDISIGGHDGAFGFRPEPVSHARGGLSLCWSPWKNFSVTPQVYYQKRLGYHPGNGGLGRDAFWGGISFNFKHDLLTF